MNDTERPEGCAEADPPPGTPLDGAELRWAEGCVPFVRTPDEHFGDLPDFPFEPRYVMVEGLRMACVDEGPRDGETVLLLHGEPSWSFLYRKMIPPLVAAGLRVVAPDLIGMGRSDKPIQLADYSYLTHVRWLEAFVDELGLEDITTFVQDWGSLIGLRMVGNRPDRFARVVVANGRLPVIPEGLQPITFPDPPLPNDEVTFPFGDDPVPYDVPRFPAMSAEFAQWALYALTSPSFQPSEVITHLTRDSLSERELAAYDAPFPSRIYMTGPRVFPSLVNTLGCPPTNQAARAVFDGWEKPMLTVFGRGDPVLGAEEIQAEMRDAVPGAVGQAHHAYDDASHFLQEDEGPDLARRLIDFVAANPLPGRQA